ncbi:MAG: 2-C-methyl-D-erythritol 4-phosphate cytidylyltransferase [Armatimonadota bacterium]
MQGTTLSAIIVAAGQSTRFGQPGKVFQMLGEQTVLEWSIRAFAGYPHTTEIIIVGQPEDHRKILAIAEEVGRGLPIKVACGGRDRQGSVANGLALAAEAELISVHDAARPGVTSDLIARIARKACEVGAAVAATVARHDQALLKRGNCGEDSRPVPALADCDATGIQDGTAQRGPSAPCRIGDR